MGGIAGLMAHLNGLPKEIREMIVNQLSEKDKASLAIAKDFEDQIQGMINSIKSLLPDIAMLKEMRDDWVKERRQLKDKKLALLESDAKLKKHLATMEKSERKKTLDDLGDGFEKGRLADLKLQISSLDREIKALEDGLERAGAALTSLRLVQRAMYEAA